MKAEIPKKAPIKENSMGSKYFFSVVASQLVEPQNAFGYGLSDILASVKKQKKPATQAKPSKNSNRPKKLD